MSSRHLLDPAFAALADMTLPDLTGDSLHERRALAAQLARQSSAAGAHDAAVLPVVERTLPGPPGAPPVRVLIYTPACDNALLPVLIQLHGGGLVMGAPENADQRNRRLAVEAACIVVSVDYRLAPETRFPGGVEDGYAVLRWMHANAASIGGDAARIAVGGESAGGGLAAALALLARDRKEIPLRFQLLTYPMLDDRTGSNADDVSPYAGEFVWSGGSNRFGWRAALGDAADTGASVASTIPARAASLKHLPAACIVVGALDLFVAENLAYASGLIDAGVPTELHVYPGAPHSFDAIDDAPASRACWQVTINALRRALHA